MPYLNSEINKNTQYAEDGSFTITYQTQPESISIQTSKIVSEGILQLEHTKEIKPAMTNLNKIEIKTSILSII